MRVLRLAGIGGGRRGILFLAGAEDPFFGFVGLDGREVGRDADPVDFLSAWGEVSGCGQADCGRVFHGGDALDRAFSESGFAEQDGAAQVFQGASDDFRAARARSVDEDGEREFAVFAVFVRCEERGRGGASRGRDDFGVWRKELGADIDGAAQESAWVVAEVEDESFCPFGFQAVQGVGKLFCGGFAELADAEVTDCGGIGCGGGEDMGIADAFHFDDGALDGEVLEFFRGGTEDGQGDFFADIAAEHFYGIGEGHPVGSFPVDFEDAVAGEDAGFECGGAFHGGEDGEGAAAEPDLDAQAAELAFRVFLEGFERGGIEELAVGV